MKTCIIISITSDIGKALAERYSRDGYEIIGTYRSSENLVKILKNDYRFYHCDIDSKASIIQFMHEVRKLEIKWDTLILCPCNPLPLQPFFECEFNEWSESIHTNAVEQLRIVHELYPYREEKANVVFFAGGGVNNAVLNFSAYTISKIILIKMCEYLDAENPDLNIFAVGPGWTRTKGHHTILRNVAAKDPRCQQTIAFLNSGRGTSMDDIYDCIRWLSSQGKEVAGGRNFSVVNDKWGSEELTEELHQDKNMYKLRRHKNEPPFELYPP